MIHELNISDDDHFTLDHGFLPKHDPQPYLPQGLEAWDEMSYYLPKLLTNTRCRNHLDNLPPFECSKLHTAEDWQRAMVVLSFIGHSYVWCEPDNVAQTLPQHIAQPWFEVASRLGRPPVLSYASYALYNWRRFDITQPPVLGNIALLQNFLGGADEEWFIVIHIDIEYQAIELLTALQPLQHAVAENNAKDILQQLQIISNAIKAMCTSLARMPEHCDPYIYYNRVRPFIHGWHENPALPNGLHYEGVSDYPQPQCFKGETGAQSAIIPCLDAVLGIYHEDNPLREHLRCMRDYMPRSHEAFLRQLENSGPIKQSIANHSQAIQQQYEECIAGIHEFRQIHYQYAASYINKQTQQSSANPTETGTGGTPFMTYLKKHLDESRS